MNPITLPPLTSIELERVQTLTSYISQKIRQNEGQISFQRFMHEALYSPLGYYTNNKQKIGAGGDFITAPMQSALFSKTFAMQFSIILKNLGEQAAIIEFGAGTGQFAFDCLAQLKALKSLPKTYYIIEISPDLKQQQQRLLQPLIESGCHIEWLSALPKQQVEAIVFANEVLDSMPVELFKIKKDSLNLVQMMVSYNEQNQFCWKENLNISPEFNQTLMQLPIKKDGLIVDYQSEFNPWIKPWLKSIAEILNKGVVFICDYGYHRTLHYSQERSAGTLQCYHKHHVHNDPLIYAGVQDITAHVDFTAVVESATELGFDLDGFSTQGNFLIKAGIMTCYQQAAQARDVEKSLALSQELQKLTLGTDFAENFKVLAVSYQYENTIDTFDDIDSSHLL